MSFKLEKIKTSHLLAEITYLSIIFLIPLYFNFFLPSFDPFETSKMILFRSLFWFLLFFSLWRFLDEAEMGRKILIFFKKYFLIFLLPLGFAFLSLIWSFDANWSWSGNLFRQTALSNEIFFVATLFLISLNLILASDIKKALRRIFRLATLSSFFVSLYAICQYFGFDFLLWQEPAQETKRAMSTLGQPNFLGSFLLLVIPLSFYLILQEKNIYRRLFLILVFASQILALLFSASRGAWVALIALVLVLILLPKRNYKIILASLIFLGFIASLLFFTNNSFSQRFKAAFDFSQGSSSVRTFLYDRSSRAFFKKPMGYGWENQREALIPYYEVSLAQRSKVNVVFDRAHNVFLDMALCLGLIGLLIYLYLYYFIFKIIKRNISGGETDRSLFLSLALAIFALFVSLLFNFISVVTIIYLYLIIAMIFALDFKKREKEFLKLEKKSSFEKEIELEEKTDFKEEKELKKIGKVYSKNNFWQKGLKFFLLLLWALISCWGLNREIKNWRADYYFAQMQISFLNNEIPQAMELFSYFQENAPLSRNYYDYFISLAFDHINFLDRVDLFFVQEKSKMVAELYYQKDNNSFFYNFHKAQALALLDRLEESWEMFYQLEKTSPFYPDLYLKEAHLARWQKNNDLAREKYKKALSLLPEEESVEGDINLQAWRYYYNLINNNLLSLD